MDLRTILIDHGIEDASKVNIDGEFDDLNKKITDLDQYLENAFYDGIIQETESRKIQLYINLLRDSNLKIQERYDQISNNDALEEGAVKSELFAAKANYDLLFSSLISTINYVIADNVATPDEAESVDNAYLNFMDASARLEKALEIAVDAIIGKRSSIAEQNARQYAEDLKGDIEKVTDDLDERLNAAEGYVDGSFRDGIITEAEAINIRSYLDSLRLKKTELDRQYDEIHNNYFLTGIAKTNLEQAKVAYDTQHDATIDAINEAISDMQATPEEAYRVRQAFVDLDSALAMLVDRLQKAVDALSQKRADEAERLAKEAANEYTDREVGVVDTILKNIAADNVITRSERIAVKDDITKITGVILGDDESMPTLAVIDASEKGEVYNSRKEALQVNIQPDHPDFEGLEEAYQDLAAYLNAMEPKPWDVVSEEDIEVDKVVWRNIWLNYYISVSVLRERISEYLKNATEEVKERVVVTEAEIKVMKERIELTVSNKIFEDRVVEVDEKIKEVEENITYKVEIISSNGNAFKNNQINTTLFAKVYHGSDDVTDELNASLFRWSRISDDPADDERWNQVHAGGQKSIDITSDDVKVRATFNCELLID